MATLPNATNDSDEDLVAEEAEFSAHDPVTVVRGVSEGSARGGYHRGSDLRLQVLDRLRAPDLVEPDLELGSHRPPRSPGGAGQGLFVRRGFGEGFNVARGPSFVAWGSQLDGELPPSDLQAQLLMRALALLATLDIAIFSPAVWAVIFADGSLEKETLLWWFVLSAMSALQAIFVFRSNLMMSALNSFPAACEARPTATKSRGLFACRLVVFHLASVSLLIFCMLMERELPVWKAVVLGAVVSYNLVTFSVHAMWMQLGCPSPVRHHGPTVKRFMQLDEQTVEKYSQCCICLDDFNGRDLVMVLACGHVLHDDCGRRWMTNGHGCPYRCQPPVVKS